MIEVTYEDDDGNELSAKLPTHWEICGACNGNETTTSHVESDGGGITASEWAEWDQDDRESYMRGDYDRPCETCKGSGKIQEVDEPDDTWSAEQKAAHDWYMDDCAGRAQDDADDAYTRRMESGGY